MVSRVPLMKLEDQSAVREQPLVLRTAVVALKSEQSLIPPAGGFDVTYRDHGLRLCPAGRNDDTDPVTGRVVDLDEPTLAVVERWAPMHGASGRHDVCERGGARTRKSRGPVRR